MMGLAGFTTSLVMLAVIITPCIHGKDHSDKINVQRLLKQLNRPTLKSIKSEDGDIIDCVPITSQLAFHHPLLNNHTIQMRPTFIPEADFNFIKKKTNALTQVWRKNGACPKHTVAIRRITKEDLLRAKFVESFRKRTFRSIPEYKTSDDSDPSKGHEYALMSSENELFFGTKFVINVWRPEVAGPNEFSLAQTWLVFGNGSGTIEVGWQVYQQRYSDTNTRLFVYWTNGGYRQGSGCQNLDCPGFVQISNKLIVGGSLNPISQYKGTQHELSIFIWKDKKNWWLKIGKELVGYWPGELFSSFGHGPTRIDWGGEIINKMSGGKHTTTDMGSGHFADEGFKKASYFRNIMIVDKSNTLKEPQRIYPYSSNANCYNVKVGDGGTNYGKNFFYGGPGQNKKCP